MVATEVLPILGKPSAAVEPGDGAFDEANHGGCGSEAQRAEDGDGNHSGRSPHLSGQTEAQLNAGESGEGTNAESN